MRIQTPSTASCAAYAAMVLAILLLDGIWLGLLAMPLYQQGIGHLMADAPRLGAGLAFYALYPLGLLVLVLQPAQGRPGRGPVLARAALFGLVAYGTYDLSNLATLRGWPVWLAALDMAWGVLLSALAAAAGLAAQRRWSR